MQKEIDEYLKRCYMEYRYTKSYLLLGTKSSGKTTIFKQLQLLQCCDENHDIFIQMYSDILNSIRTNCVLTIIKLCNQNNELNTAETLKRLSINDPNHLIEIKDKIQSIWQSNYTRFNKIVPENMCFYMNRIDDIMDVDYKLSVKDIIKHSTFTIIDEITFEIKENTFQFIDIGSKPFNLKSYIHVFDNTNLIIYTVSLSDYCKNITTEHGTVMNALLYSLEHFFDIVKSKKLRLSEWCVFLNKNDIFIEQLKEGISLSVCFGDKWNGPDFVNPNIPLIVSSIIRRSINYEIPNDIIQLLCQYITIRYMDENGKEVEEEEFFEHCYEKAICFIQNQFLMKWKEIIPEQYGKYSWMTQLLYFHVLNATDTDSVQKVYWDIWGIVTRSNLKRGGLREYTL
eukprot:392617_1